MELNEIASYLGAAAASDAPIDGKETDLLKHLLKDFGAEMAEAQKLVSSLPTKLKAADLGSLDSRELALKLLRALLVISYCDGTFDREELPFLTPIVDRFKVSRAELQTARLQALYFLKLDPPSVKIPAELLKSEDWDAICESADKQYDAYRKDFQKRFEEELSTADEETCYLAMAVGPPSFDTEHTQSRFLQNNPDFAHTDDAQGLQLLRDQAEKRLRNQWEAAYASRCNFCYLEAPGKRRDPCPRCAREYGEAATP